jgi:hypothetical protein
MSSRDEVYQAINSERSYQEALKGVRNPKYRRTMGDYLTLLNHYIVEANQSYVKNRGPAMPLHEFRKIAAIAVKCMEEFGAPKR